ncbi:MAG: hypothetical protein HY363_05560 [Candidatus Aenigmarchaeota archaeon]|nr:hypothetical protein [Candidatus Aenigmarchaeota archaeon]
MVWSETQKQEILQNMPAHELGVVQSVLDQVREELDDHLQSINENTTEIQSNYGCILELERKMNALIERLDALEWVVRGKQQKKNEPLRNISGKELVVFRAIYRLGMTHPFVAYRDIARKAGLTDVIVASLVTSLIEKGVPIVKRYEGSLVFLKLEESFREAQAKRNLVGAEVPLSCWL